MTNQETFDTVVAHLRKQGRPAIRAGQCKYRACEGLKCAAGCLIPDDKYLSSFEGKLALPGTAPGDLIESLGHSLNLVGILQTIHDDDEPENWEREWLTCAADFGLVYTRPAKGATQP